MLDSLWPFTSKPPRCGHTTRGVPWAFLLVGIEEILDDLVGFRAQHSLHLKAGRLVGKVAQAMLGFAMFLASHC